MNKEEKEAIEELKKFSNLIIEGGIPNSFIVNKLKIVFNLIDKLQKELEQQKKLYDKLFNGYNERVQEIIELEKENDNLKTDYQILQDDLKEHNIIYTDTPEFEENYIHKDKIRDKIEKLDKLSCADSAERIGEDIELLESLLEDE